MVSFFRVEEISPAKTIKQAGGKLTTCLLPGFLLNLFLRPWRWRRYVPPKRRLTFNGLQGVVFQKMILFITTAVKI
jgi:hypothetical protein